MRKIFLGKPLHWLGVAVVAVALWQVGGTRLHVTWFNAFTGMVLVAAVVLIVLVLSTTGEGERVTRDPIKPPDDAA